ncbi:ABC transporter substrate-binding protein [Propylenella binzhouense]|uniref:ABC transporter substrate-binding protein n=1 Tax=Propylenella binzhouense TaxID=2555902 RepID=A0A964T5Z0_9HYPH|nr:ABC transporter substrate-binding protein [Propylenella binzhouense]MYZ48512.1 ABC transporter substrate-binding protein [Propylenella binzhouense]
MTKKLSLTLACGDYEIVRPLKEGTVEPDGIELNILTGADSTTRHWRFLRNQEYDVAECSASSYIVARDRGMPFRALPVFLHRRFRHGFVFINTGKGITRPTDLIGRKVGVKSYQVTAILWLRGILEQEYGVPHKSIEWFAELDEDVEFTPPEGLRLSKIPDEKSIETMLAEGEIDALLHPDIIDPIIEGDPRVGRLFPDYKAEEMAYYAKTGIFPIMHVLGFKQALVEAHPWIVPNLYQAFEQAKAIAMKRMRNPRLVPLAWYQEAWEEQEKVLGPDPWEYGLGERNRKNFETLVGYSHQQGLISRPIPLDELFLSTSQGRKRGTFRT